MHRLRSRELIHRLQNAVDLCLRSGVESAGDTRSMQVGKRGAVERRGVDATGVGQVVDDEIDELELVSAEVSVHLELGKSPFRGSHNQFRSIVVTKLAPSIGLADGGSPVPVASISLDGKKQMPGRGALFRNVGRYSKSTDTMEHSGGV